MKTEEIVKLRTEIDGRLTHIEDLLTQVLARLTPPAGTPNITPAKAKSAEKKAD